MYYVYAVNYNPPERGIEPLTKTLIGKRWFSWTAKRLVRKHLKDKAEYILTDKSGFAGHWAVDVLEGRSISVGNVDTISTLNMQGHSSVVFDLNTTTN
jgi:hypothetical protein